MSWFKEITKEFEHVAGSDKHKQSGDASYGYPGQAARYGAPPPPGQYGQAGYPPAPPPAQPYGYAPPPAQVPYGYPAPPQPYGQLPPPGLPSQASYAPPLVTGYGAPTPGAPPPPAYEPPPLPPGWSVHWDAYRGRPFYFEIASRRTEWFLPLERDPAMMRDPAFLGPAIAASQGEKAKTQTKGHGTGALVAAGAAGVIGGAVLGGLAVHEEHKLKEEWDEDREEISYAGQEFQGQIREDEQSAFRNVAETEGEYKAYEEEGYERTLDNDDDDY